MSPHSVDDTSVLLEEDRITFDKGKSADPIIEPITEPLAVRPANGTASSAFELEDHPIDATSPLRVCRLFSFK
jgi:hypothetical protein